QQQVNQIDLLAPAEPGSGGQDQRVPRDQYSIDPDTATVTFKNMLTFTLDLSPQFLQRPPQLGGKVGVQVQWLVNGQPQAQPAYVPVPLIYYFDPPSGKSPFDSSPVIAGGHIYAISRGVL